MRASRVFTGLLLLIFPCIAGAQTDSVVEQRMTRRVLSCDDILLNATTLLPRYARLGAHDSVDAVLRFADRRCGVYGLTPLYFFRLLYAVDTGSADALVTREILRELNYYRRYRDDPAAPRRVGPAPPRVWYTPPVDEGYYRFLQEYGGALAGRPGKTPTSRWIATFFASEGDSTAFAALNEPEYRNTALGRAYTTSRRVPGLYLSATAGLLVPQGPLRAVGIHPTFGFSLGAISRRWTFEMPFFVAFGNSRRDYEVPYNGVLTQTRYYQSAHIGLSADYAFFRTPQLEAAVCAGAGYESLTAIKDSSPDNGINDAKLYPTLNLNAGIILRHYISANCFLGLTGRYNRLSYNNPSGTDLSGNSVTVGVVFGGAPGMRALRRSSWGTSKTGAESRK